MNTINYSDYLDRVYGCWLGKCVAGTVGAPYEGMKELLNFEFDPAMIETTLPNDDLDLQILWLAVLEKKGIDFTPNDLAEAFFTRCPYAPGEYAIFKKNYARGIRPPTSGGFNNQYYIEGMGCPIRSEIWACIAPGNPKLAAELAAKDGVLDHRGNSVLAEQFLAGLESAAFFESDLDKLIDVGLSLIPQVSRADERSPKISKLITDVRDWCKKSDDWRYVRSQILRKYGHPDCTNLFQNIGITILSLYLGEMDLIKTTMIALNCGFDTDCTCATAGAILGIIHGAKRLIEKHDLHDNGYDLKVDAPRRSNSIFDLAEDTAAMGIYFAEQINKETKITDAPVVPVIRNEHHQPVDIQVLYVDKPAIGIGDSRNIYVRFINKTQTTIQGSIVIDLPIGWRIDTSSAYVELGPCETKNLSLRIKVNSDIPVLQERNICHVTFTPENSKPITYDFGLVGAAVWKVFGPFWQNNTDMSEIKPGERYHKYFNVVHPENDFDVIRTYHLNTRVDLNHEYMTTDEILGPPTSGDAAKEGQIFNAYEDLFSVNDMIGFQGPCVVYAIRRLISPEQRTLGIQIGHTDAFKLWINGDLVSERDNTDWWTAENVHIKDFTLKKGLNTILVKLVRRSANANFSIVFTKGGPCTEHYFDFASENPGIAFRNNI